MEALERTLREAVGRSVYGETGDVAADGAGEESLAGGMSISCAAYGFYQGWPGGVGVDLFAKIQDVLIERAGLGKIFEAPAFVEQFIASDDFPGLFCQQGDELDLTGRELDFLRSCALMGSVEPSMLWK